MSILAQIKEPVKEELKQFEKHFRQAVKSDVLLIDVVMNYIIRTKGKQIRPLIVFLSARLHGEPTPSTYTAASMIELLHTATLIHDDVVDESYKRRGFFSINALWKSKAAVLIGDFLYSKGLLLTVENREFEILGIVSKAVKLMSEGELLQMQKSRGLSITEKDYFDIISKKTASLFAACFACGASSLKLEARIIDQMWEIGRWFGIAFQIMDDLLDYEKTGITGKPSGNDIREKKITLPLILSLNRSGGSEKRRILKLLGKNNKGEKGIEEIVNFVKENGGITNSRQVMVEYSTKVTDTLSAYPDSPVKDSIMALTRYIINRKA